MYVLMVYDVQAKYCGKVLGIARKYLNWTQNSVLEGELSAATYKKMIKDLDSRVKLKEIGSVLLYSWPCEKYVKKDCLGKQTSNKAVLFRYALYSIRNCPSPKVQKPGGSDNFNNWPFLQYLQGFA